MYTEEQRIHRALELREDLQVAFSVAAAEHAILNIDNRLRERGFDQITRKAIWKLWMVAKDGTMDVNSLEELENKCVDWAPSTEDEPESEDIMYGLLVVAYACRVARRIEPKESFRYLIGTCEQTVASHAYQKDPRDPTIKDITHGDAVHWERHPKVIEEVRYQSALLDALAAIGNESIDRKSLLIL